MTELTLRYTATEADHRPATTTTSILGYVTAIATSIADAQRCRADQEIGRLIQQNGGVITDEVERRIQRHLGA